MLLLIDLAVKNGWVRLEQGEQVFFFPLADGRELVISSRGSEIT